MSKVQENMQVRAFQFLQDEGNKEELRSQGFLYWEKINNDLPDMHVYDVEVFESPFRNSHSGGKLLRVTQVWFEDGDRSNLTHNLYDTDWLIEDTFCETGYRVISDDKMKDFDN